MNRKFLVHQLAVANHKGKKHRKMSIVKRQKISFTRAHFRDHIILS